jgi:MazG family protein
MSVLRSPTGCPWDREQSHESLKPFLIEESYEVLEALDHGDDNMLCEELGDLLLQIIFHAQIAQESNRFTIYDILQKLIDKLERRHPHIFGQGDIATSSQQRIHWEKIKKSEGKKSVLEGIPKALPALLHAFRVQQKAATVGFNWKNRKDVWEKVVEEIDELTEATDSKNQEAIVEEFGDMLFALVNFARFIQVDPETALKKATEKFIQRFQKIEKIMIAQGKSIESSSLEEMDAIWDRIKGE